MEKQTEILADSVAAAQKSADAAEISAQAIVNAERAWLVESIQFVGDIPARPVGGGVITARVTIKNIGKQPALLKFVQLSFHSVEGALPQTPEYPGTQYFPDGFMVAPGEEKHLRALLQEGSFDCKAVERIRGLDNARPLKLYIYGKVAYMSMGRLGINQFCYEWNNRMGFSLGEAKPYFEKDGPSGYNSHI